MSRAIADHPLPRTAAIYRRVSSLKQSAEDKYSLETQEDAARAWCAANGWTPGEVFTDVHSAEDLWQRPELMRLLADVSAGRYGLVLAHAVDRLSREQTGAHLAIIAEQVERAGAQLDCVTEHLDATPQGAMIRTFKAFAAGMENEKRVERTQRIRRKRAESGKYLGAARPLYGYAFGPETDNTGRLTKERLVEDPVTAAVVRRIFHEVASGKSTRRIAYDLTEDGIPTPSGRPVGDGVRWEQGSIRYILRTSTYWGEPMALRSVTVAVPVHLRATPARPRGPNGERLYKHKTREIPRDVADQKALPPTVAPALVSREIAETVTARMAWNREHAAALLTTSKRGTGYQSLLSGGFGVCGGCGGALSVHHSLRTVRAGNTPPGTIRHRYTCRRHLSTKGACTPRSIECALLDAKVWLAVTAFLQDREWIEQEVERLRAQPDPGGSTLEGIDRQIAELDQRIERKRKYAEAVEDDRERRHVASEVSELWRQRDGLSATREGATLHYASVAAQRDGLNNTLDWCARVGANMPTADFDTRRLILSALHVHLTLYRGDETPRVRMTLALPLSGVREIPLDLDDHLSDDVQPEKGMTPMFQTPQATSAKSSAISGATKASAPGRPKGSGRSSR